MEYKLNKSDLLFLPSLASSDIHLAGEWIDFEIKEILFDFLEQNGILAIVGSGPHAVICYHLDLYLKLFQELSQKQLENIFLFIPYYNGVDLMNVCEYDRQYIDDYWEEPLPNMDKYSVRISGYVTGGVGEDNYDVIAVRNFIDYLSLRQKNFERLFGVSEGILGNHRSYFNEIANRGGQIGLIISDSEMPKFEIANREELHKTLKLVKRYSTFPAFAKDVNLLK